MSGVHGVNSEPCCYPPHGVGELLLRDRPVRSFGSSALAKETDISCERDRRFVSIFLQRGVGSELNSDRGRALAG